MWQVQRKHNFLVFTKLFNRFLVVTAPLADIQTNAAFRRYLEALFLDASIQREQVFIAVHGFVRTRDVDTALCAE